MKKMLRTATSILALAMMMIFATTANATDCSQSVKLVCGVFDNAAGQINKCRSLDDVANIDFANLVGGQDIPAECNDYVLTKDDKSNICKSINKFIDTLELKMVEFGGGMITRSYIAGEMKPMRDYLNNAVNNSKTIGEMADKFENME